MLIKALQIKKWDNTHIYYNLSEYSFLIRSNIKEIITAMFKTIENELAPSVNEKLRTFNHDKIDDTFLVTYQNDNVMILIVCSNKVKLHNLMTLIYKLRIAKDEKEEDIILKNSEQLLSENDKIDMINVKINETKEILMESIESIIQRGHKLEDLMITSQHLSDSSKIFLKKSAKLNRCCIIS